MSPKYGGFGLLLLPLLLLVVSCGGPLDCDGSGGTTVYLTSFESEADLVGWQGITADDLRDDHAPQGGKKSIFVSGGCSVPHASLTFSPSGEDRVVSVECFCKNLLYGGSVGLYVGASFSQSVSVIAADTAWTHYTCENAICWPADSTLTVYMISGGYVGSAMLVDRLRVSVAD
jgi:hypothetical protein